MKRAAIIAAIYVAIICSLSVTAAGQASAGSARYNSSELMTTLEPETVHQLNETLFKDVAVYPSSYSYYDLTAYVPGSFAMLAYIAPTSKAYKIADYYERSMKRAGWKLIDKWGVSNNRHGRTQHATLTFRRYERIVTVDITRDGSKHLKYSIFAYLEEE